MGDKVYIDEYQDKYYFVKNLKELFPDLSDNEIYDCIQRTEETLRGTREKRKYAHVLYDVLKSVQQEEGRQWKQS